MLHMSDMYNIFVQWDAQKVFSAGCDFEVSRVCGGDGALILSTVQATLVRQINSDSDTDSGAHVENPLFWGLLKHAETNQGFAYFVFLTRLQTFRNWWILMDISQIWCTMTHNSDCTGTGCIWHPRDITWNAEMATLTCPKVFHWSGWWFQACLIILVGRELSFVWHMFTVNKSNNNKHVYIYIYIWCSVGRSPPPSPPHGGW